MSIPRSILLGLAASAASLPLMAQGAAVDTSAAGLAQVQLAQSPTFSVSSTQDLLNRLGYDAGPADGIMGNRTRSAIMAYQRDRGLQVTGQASSGLYADMLQVYAQARPAGTTTTTATATQPREDTVIWVQTELRRRGYEVPAISGQVDAATLAAIMAYKRDAGLPVSGDITQPLVDSLNSSATVSADYADQRELVRAIQTELSEQGYSAGAADGTLSPATRAAIRTYEADQGLPVTGQASDRLLARLEATGGTGTVGINTVAAIQEELITRGYLQGNVDGRVGAATSAAIREFQRDAGLPVTGTASAELLTTLRASDLTRDMASRRQTIGEIERELALKGYRVAEPDGILDAQTAAAIRQFEQDAGLTVTGEADAELLSTLRTSTVVAGPLTPEQAMQGIIQGTTQRLLESIVTE